MTERPILFSGPMVRAILEGRKSQTRRVVKPQPLGGCTSVGPNTWGNWEPRSNQKNVDSGALAGQDEFLPPYKPGMRLWVRETWAKCLCEPTCEGVYFAADDDAEGAERSPWKSPIHMPRWASRITLEVTGVRVERVQEMGSSDAIMEGCYKGLPTESGGIDFVSEYRLLWDSINSKRGYGWDANPWVWVVEFRRV